MFPVRPSVLVPLSLSFLFVACGGTSSPASSPSAETESEPTPSEPVAPADRPELTAEACEAGGGTIIGDIGDGAIHRPDYRCASGAEPTGSIMPPPGGPVAIEGSVCCPK